MKKVLASKYKCPCCDYYTYPVPTKEAVGFICPVCFWENDIFISFKKSLLPEAMEPIAYVGLDKTENTMLMI